MTLQFQIDFDAKLPPSAQMGMQQADSNAEPRWKREIDACILAVAKRKEEFTVDDILAEVETLPHAFRTHNNSALGPRMVEVSRTLKYMTATDRKVRSETRHKHGNLRTVWKSNVFGVKS